MKKELFFRRFVLAAWFAAALGFFFTCVRVEGDFAGYIDAGEQVLRGQNIYQNATNTWPPVYSILCVPLALLDSLSKYISRGAWIMLTMAALVLLFRQISDVVYDKKFSCTGRDGSLWLGSPEIALPAALNMLYIANNFLHLQVHIPLFALTMTGLLWSARGRPVQGGMLIGLAAAIKIMPLAFIPYLFYRRQWKTALSAFFSAVAISIAPALVFGWSGFIGLVHTWFRVLHAGWGVGKMNQSVFAMIDRYLGHGLVPFAGPGEIDMAESGQLLVKVILLGSLALVALAGLWLFRGKEPPCSRASVIEWTIVFIVSVLFGTVCWKSYLVVMLLATALFIDLWKKSMAKSRHRKWIAVLLGGTFLVAGIMSPDLFGNSVVDKFEMASNHTIAVLAVLAGLFIYRRNLLLVHRKMVSKGRDD